MHLPASIGDYTDFYACEEHSRNATAILRTKIRILLPNWYLFPQNESFFIRSNMVPTLFLMMSQLGNKLEQPCYQKEPKSPKSQILMHGLSRLWIPYMYLSKEKSAALVLDSNWCIQAWWIDRSPFASNDFEPTILEIPDQSGNAQPSKQASVLICAYWWWRAGQTCRLCRLHLPVAYHGRASSVVVSGTDIRRPRSAAYNKEQVFMSLRRSQKVALQGPALWMHMTFFLKSPQCDSASCFAFPYSREWFSPFPEDFNLTNLHSIARCVSTLLSYFCKKIP